MFNEFWLQNVEVHFISALCENMVSAEAMRPGDVLVSSNGKTIEVSIRGAVFVVVLLLFGMWSSLFFVFDSQ